MILAAAPLAAQSLQFDFAPGKACAGVPEGAIRDDVFRGGRLRLRRRRHQPPFYFSVRVPEEGNYRVTVTLGDPAADSVTTIKAELRRLMLERVRVAAGKTETRSFLVNVRTPKIPGGGEVQLKDREKTTEARAWDNRSRWSSPTRIPAVRIAGDREGRRRSHDLHRRRLYFHRSAAGTVQQLGADAAALLQARNRHCQSRRIGRVAARIPGREPPGRNC
jgi:hypothetical protein